MGSGGRGSATVAESGERVSYSSRVGGSGGRGSATVAVESRGVWRERVSYSSSGESGGGGGSGGRGSATVAVESYGVWRERVSYSSRVGGSGGRGSATVAESGGSGGTLAAATNVPY